MSCRTKRHHTKSLSLSASALANASTAGSASPSFIPDSRLSEWRTTRGTRGFVTTEEESTGSVGDSSAPSRNASVHPRPTSACAQTAISAPVIGMARASLRSGSRQAVCSISASTSSPSRNRITISATVASALTKPDVGSNSSTPSPPCPSANPTSTNTAVSERNDRRATPDRTAPIISSAPNTSRTSSTCEPAAVATITPDSLAARAAAWRRAARPWCGRSAPSRSPPARPRNGDGHQGLRGVREGVMSSRRRPGFPAHRDRA